MPENPKITAIVVAAGLSSRMQGENKLLLPFGSSTVIGETLTQLAKSMIFEIIVVTGRDHTQVSEEIHRAGVFKVKHNKHFSQGLTTSIQTGVREASRKSQGYMICLGDMPLIVASEYARLVHYFEAEKPKDSRLIVVPTHNGKKGNPVIFSSAYREQILYHQELNGCKKIIEDSRMHVHKCDFQTNHILADIDTREEYQKILTRSQ